MLGRRGPEIYGSDSLAAREVAAAARATELGFYIDFRQSNGEGELVDWIQVAGETHAALIINAGAYTHTSLAIADAIEAVEVMAAEVHLSNVFAREQFRHVSYLSPVVRGQVVGFGFRCYLAALDLLPGLLTAGEDES